MSLLALDPVPALALRIAGALVFGWAAAHKLREPTGFRAALAGYRLLPERAVAPVAWLLVASEVSIGLACLLAAGSRSASLAPLAAVGLLLLYAGAIAANLLRGRPGIECGCGGGSGPRPLSGSLVVRNVLVAALLASAALPASPRPLVWLDAPAAAGLVTALAFLHQALDTALANAARLRATGDFAWSTR